MISLTIKNTELCLDFSFFAAIAIFAFFDKTGLGLASIAMCMLHESAHLLVMLIVDEIPDRIRFYGAGIAITSRGLDSRVTAVRAAVYSAGCLLNFFLALTFWLSGNGVFSAINLCIGMLNMLPVGELDGSRILRLAAEHFLDPIRTERVLRISSIVSLVFCVSVFFAVRGRISVSAIISGIYLMILSVLKNE